jgi:hypothetical protein
MLSAVCLSSAPVADGATGNCWAVEWSRWPAQSTGVRGPNAQGDAQSDRDRSVSSKRRQRWAPSLLPLGLASSVMQRRLHQLWKPSSGTAAAVASLNVCQTMGHK